MGTRTARACESRSSIEGHLGFDQRIHAARGVDDEQHVGVGDGLAPVAEKKLRVIGLHGECSTEEDHCAEKSAQLLRHAPVSV